MQEGCSSANYGMLAGPLMQVTAAAHRVYCKYACLPDQ